MKRKFSCFGFLLLFYGICAGVAVIGEAKTIKGFDHIYHLIRIPILAYVLLGALIIIVAGIIDILFPER